MRLYRCKILYYVLLLPLFSCGMDELSGEINIPDITPSLGVPIGSATYTIDSLIQDLADSSSNNTGVEIDPGSKVLTIVFSDTLDEFNDTGSFLAFDNNISDSRSVLAPISFGDASMSVTRTFNDTLSYPFSLSGEEIIKEIRYLEAGTSMITIEASVGDDVTINNLRLVFPNTINDTGDTLIVNFSGPISQAGSPVTEEIDDLGNYITSFDIDTDNNSFTRIFVEMSVTAPSGTVIAQDAELLSLTSSFEDIEYRSVLGYFGQKTVSLSEKTFNLEFFDDMNPGSLRFKDPQVIITTETNLGIPMVFDLSGIEAIRDGESVALKPINPNDSVYIPEVAFELGDTSDVVVDINARAGGYNLVDIFASSPQTFVAPLIAMTNHLADTLDPPLTNFIVNDGFAKPRVDIRLPFSVVIDSLSLDVSQPYEFRTAADIDEIDSATLRIKATNGMPFVGVVYLDILLDGEVINMISLGDTIMSAPNLDASFNVSSPSEEISLIALSKETLEDLLKGNGFEIRVVFDTKSISGNRALDFKSGSELTFDISVILDTSLGFK